MKTKNKILSHIVFAVSLTGLCFFATALQPPQLLLILIFGWVLASSLYQIVSKPRMVRFLYLMDGLIVSLGIVATLYLHSNEPRPVLVFSISSLCLVLFTRLWQFVPSTSLGLRINTLFMVRQLGESLAIATLIGTGFLVLAITEPFSIRIPEKAVIPMSEHAVKVREEVLDVSNLMVKNTDEQPSQELKRESILNEAKVVESNLSEFWQRYGQQLERFPHLGRQSAKKQVATFMNPIDTPKAFIDELLDKIDTEKGKLGAKVVLIPGESEVSTDLCTALYISNEFGARIFRATLQKVSKGAPLFGWSRDAILNVASEISTQFPKNIKSSGDTFYTRLKKEFETDSRKSWVKGQEKWLSRLESDIPLLKSKSKI